MWRPSATAAWLAVIIVLLAVLKIPYTLAWTFPAGHDAGYYTNIVQNLLEGNGLTTHVSLYHRGFASFPHQDSIYPLWPLTYAAFASVFPLYVVAVWLPALLYFVSLFAAYAWARRLFPAPLSRRIPGFGAAHVVVLMLGLQTVYWEHTSRPYTEGLAYSLLFLFFWRAVRLFARLDVRAGLEVGVWLGVLMLVRSQFAIVVAGFAVAGVGALALYANERRRVLLFGVAAIAAMVVTFMPYLVYVIVQTEMFSPWNYIFFGETPLDSPLSQARPYIRPEGLAFLGHIAHGFGKAYWLGRGGTYRDSYHVFQYAVPAVVLVGAVFARLWAADGGVAAVKRWLKDPKNAALLFFGAVALIGFLSLHLLGKNLDRWYFHKRHNLVALPLFFFALTAMLRSRHTMANIVGGVILLMGILLGVHRLGVESIHRFEHPQGSPKRAIVRWINQEQLRVGRPLVIAFNLPQIVVWQTPRTGYHEVNVEITTLDDVLIMFDKLGVDYLLSPTNRDARHRLPVDRFENELMQVGQIGSHTILKRRPADQRRVLSTTTAAPEAPPVDGDATDEPED